jgi:maleate isomerase
VANAVRLGLLTPSSNTCVEPVTAAFLRPVESRVSAHFARFPVTRIALGAEESAQFDFEPMLAAARLLADAQVDVIAWCGTSGSWLGIDVDRELCRRIEAATSIPATTSTLALLEAFVAYGVRRYGLAVPYTQEVTARIEANYAAAGFECVARDSLGITENFAFDQVPPAEITRLVESVAGGADAVAVVCTNLRAAPLVEELESRLRGHVIDSTIATLWHALQIATGSASISGWGDLALNGTLRSRLQAILDDLLRATDASRTTVRLDLPDRRLHVDTVAAEAVATGVKPIRNDSSLDQWAMPTIQFLVRERRLLVQNDFAVDGPPVSPALVSAYGVQAQMLGPLVRDDRLLGWISVHQVGRSRTWSAEDQAALDQACSQALALLEAESEIKVTELA